MTPLLLLGAASLAGCAAPIDGTITTHTLTSSRVDQTYTLTVFEPDTLTPSTTVVYLFDGDDWTEETAGIVSALARDGVADAPLIVGIGYGDTPNERARDYTPPGDDIPDGHGEVEAFYGFMTEELVPWVDETWETDTSAQGRALIGHSFGGIAAVWGLLYHADTFGGVIALSPSLAFAQGTLFDREAAFAEDNDDLIAAVYLGAGSQEAYGLAGLTEAFGERLASRQHPGLTLQTELIRGEFHASVFPSAAEAGLSFVLGAP